MSGLGPEVARHNNLGFRVFTEPFRGLRPALHARGRLLHWQVPAHALMLLEGTALAEPNGLHGLKPRIGCRRIIGSPARLQLVMRGPYFG